MTFFNKDEWFGNVRADVLSGLVVALALIPEAIAFSIIAGVDPKVGLYASFCIAVTISFFGSRSAMISAATGAMALLMVTLVKDHGLEYLLAATVLTGILQIIAGYLNLGSLMSFVSKSVVTGFVNALAILIFMAQLPELTNVGMNVYLLTALGLAIIYLFPYVPKLGKIIPSPLVCILTVTAITLFFNLDIRTVGDMGNLPDSLPVFLWPEVPFNFETFKIILPYSISLTIVGLLESLMTATIVDEYTDTRSDRNRECKGQGISNIVAGLFGGMAGCAMIGQSVINVTSGGRGRLSTFLAGIFLLIMVVFSSQWISMIPMAALVAVMIMVSISTFSWKSLKDTKVHPLSTTVVMVTTVLMVVFTHNLAYGVFSGVLLASLFFANKMSKHMSCKTFVIEEKTTLEYRIIGQVFFNSSERFVDFFDFKDDYSKIIIDLNQAHFWDISAVAVLDKVVMKFKKANKEVDVVGLNTASKTIVDRFGVYEKAGSEDILAAH